MSSKAKTKIELKYYRGVKYYFLPYDVFDALVTEVSHQTRDKKKLDKLSKWSYNFIHQRLYKDKKDNLYIRVKPKELQSIKDKLEEVI